MSFGPQFTPPIMSAEFVTAQIAALAARTGICHADRCDWLVPLIIEADQSGIPCDRAVLQDDRFLPSLTDLGRAAPEWAAVSIILAAPFARSRAREIQEAVELGRPNRLSAVMDRRTCDAAKALNKTVFPIGEEPSLPLANCNAWHCRCSFVGHYPRRTAVAD